MDLSQLRETFKAVFDVFETDAQREVDGVEFEYMGMFTVVIARAGGANKRYSTALEEATKPHRRALQLNVPGMNKKAEEIMQDVYANTVVLNIYGDAIGRKKSDAFDPEIAKALFKQLPAFFQEVKDQAESIALFRRETREAAAGNS